MSNSSVTILVMGATGQQGGATARHLIANGWRVRALIRDPSSAAAQQLQSLGAELVVGDMANAASLNEAMKNAHGVFSVQPPSWSPDRESDAHEVQLGRLAADCAHNAGVRHFVYTSVLGSEHQAEFGRLEHKYEIEKHIWNIGIEATVLRPSGFMENFLLPAFGLAQNSLFELTNPGIELPLIAVDDIGAIAANVFDQPERFKGQTIELAGDRKTPPNIAAALSRALGHTITYVHVPIESLPDQHSTLANLYRWVNANGYPPVNIASLREIHPRLLSFDDWLQDGGARRISASIQGAR